jgi:hypothetical protein
MDSFRIANAIPEEVADNGTVRMGGAIKCQIINICATNPAFHAATHHAAGFFHFLTRLFG